MNETDERALEAFSRGEMPAIEVRRRLGDATFGEILALLSERDLPLPRAPVVGREAQINLARTWMFPKHGP